MMKNTDLQLLASLLKDKGDVVGKYFPYSPSEISLSRISQAKMVGFSLLYCSILETTAGVATLGLLPPISPGGLSVPSNMFIYFQTRSSYKRTC